MSDEKTVTKEVVKQEPANPFHPLAPGETTTTTTVETPAPEPVKVTVDVPAEADKDA